jgi:hypothetical protein
VIGRQRDHFRIVALTARSNEAALGRQVAQWQPAYSALVSKTGPEALVEAATHPDVDIVLNAVVGSAGLDATLARFAPANGWPWPTRKRWSWRAIWCGQPPAPAAVNWFPWIRSTAPSCNVFMVGRPASRE